MTSKHCLLLKDEAMKKGVDIVCIVIVNYTTSKLSWPPKNHE